MTKEEYDATTEWFKLHGLSAQGQYKKLLSCFDEWKDLKAEEN